MSGISVLGQGQGAFERAVIAFLVQNMPIVVGWGGFAFQNELLWNQGKFDIVRTQARHKGLNTQLMGVFKNVNRREESLLRAGALPQKVGKLMEKVGIFVHTIS